MKCIEPGHVYALDHLDGAGEEVINFVNRGHGADAPGTNNQEVLRALIDRVKFLDNEMPWEKNSNIIYHLRMALILHEQRHLERAVDKGCSVENLMVGPDGHIAILSTEANNEDPT